MFSSDLLNKFDCTMRLRSDLLHESIVDTFVSVGLLFSPGAGRELVPFDIDRANSGFAFASAQLAKAFR